MKKRPAPALGVVVLVVVSVFFVAELGGPANLLYAPGSEYSDLALTHLPNARYMRASVLQSHVWPLWNPEQLSGMPFAANPLSGLWYPPNWILLIVPASWGFNILLLGHLLIGGWGMLRLMKRLGTGRAGALAAAIGWSLTPKVWAHLGVGHVGLVFASGWLPWAADAAARLTTGRRTRAGVLQLALAWGAQLLADPRLAAYSGLALAGAAVWINVFRKAAEGRSRWHFLLPWVAAALLALSLTAVAWVPLADFLPQTSRPALTSGESAAYSLPAGYLLGLVWANRGGFHEWMTYVGVSVLVLALPGWLSLKRWLRWGITCALLALVLFSLGDSSLVFRLAAHLPGATLLRVPPRVWFLVSFVLVWSAGMGAAALVGERPASVQAMPASRRQRRWLARLAVAVLAGSGFLAGGVWFVNRPAAGPPLAAFCWLALALAGVALAARRRTWAPYLLAALVAIELIWMDASLVEHRAFEESLSEASSAVAFLADQAGRVYAPSFVPSPAVAAANGIRLVNGVEPMQPANYARFMRAAAGWQGTGGYSITVPPLPADEPVATALTSLLPSPELLAVLDADWVVSRFPIESRELDEIYTVTGDGLHLYRNLVDVQWPAVYERVESVPDLEAAIAWLADQGPEQGAVVTNGPELAGPLGSRLAQTVLSSPNRIVVRATGPGLLVVSELYLPGWHATLDGARAELVPADGVLRGVYLPAGEHRVEMTYRPLAQVVGAAGSALGCLVFLALVIRQRRDSDG